MSDLKLVEVGGKVAVVRQNIEGIGPVWIATNDQGQWGVGETVAEAVTQLHDNPRSARPVLLPAASGSTN